MLDDAISYALKGFAVFPCKPLAKEPACEHGHLDATTSERQIRAWWARTPQANIGWRPPEGVTVLDVDGPAGCRVWAAGVMACTVDIPVHPWAATPGGGEHHVCRGLDVGQRVRIAPHIDTRTHDGYVILPPSRHPNGKAYGPWAHDLRSVDIPDFPPELLSALETLRDTSAGYSEPGGPSRASAYGLGALRRACAAVRAAPQGGRNAALNRAAYGMGQLIAGGEIPHARAWEALRAEALQRGLAAAEIDKTIKSGMSAGMKIPRSAPEQINVQGGFRETIAAAEAALVHSGMVYRRGAVLSAVADGEISALSADGLRGVAAHAVSWVRYGKEGVVIPDQPPPMPVVKTLLARPLAEYPEIVGLADTPQLRPDGSILATPGYDTATRLWYAPACAYPGVPDQPTAAMARQALSRLQEPFCDFPFGTPADQAVALACLLTVLARSALGDRATVPAFVLSAPKAGTGKSLLAYAICDVAIGGTPTVVAQTKESETEKRITAALLCGARVLMLDNVKHRVGGSALEGSLTTGEWSGRELGHSRMVTLPQTMTIIIAGNNPTLTPDMARRCLRAHMDRGTERPELHTGYKHPDLRAWIRKVRPQLVATGLTILRAYHVAGRPQKSAPLGSFEAWSRLVRDALIWAGCPDPVSTQHALRESADTDSLGWAGVLEVWQAAFGDAWVSAGKVLAEPRMLEPLSMVATGELTARYLAHILRRWADAPVAGLVLQRGPTRHATGYPWRVVARKGEK